MKAIELQSNYFLRLIASYKCIRDNDVVLSSQIPCCCTNANAVADDDDAEKVKSATTDVKTNNETKIIMMSHRRYGIALFVLTSDD